MCIDSAEVRLTAERMLGILFVDDEPTARDVATQYLQSDGHLVVNASEGGETIQMVTSGRFYLVIADHGMCGISDIQLADAATSHRSGKAVVAAHRLCARPGPGGAAGIGQLHPEKPLAPDELLSAPRAPGSDLVVRLSTVSGSGQPPQKT